MRVLKSLACAVVAVRAEMEDDDLAYVRVLQSNSTGNGTATTTTTTTTTTDPNATTTTTTTVDPNATTTTTTTTTTDPNATTTTTLAPTTTDPNATTTTTLAATTTVAATTAAATTTVASSNATTTVAATTVAATTTGASSQTEGPKQETEGPKDKGPGPKTLPPMPKKEVPANVSNDTTPVEVVLTSEVTVEPPFTVPAFSASSRLRRMAAHSHAAYNLFCDAFTLTSGLVACQALQTAGAIPADGATNGAALYASGDVLFPSIDYCQVNIESPVTGTNCADTSAKGHCIDNMAANGMSDHTGCTVHEAVSGSTQYKYKTETKFTIAGHEAPEASDIAAVKTSTATKMADATTTSALQAYMVVAVVEMSKDPSIAATVNFTEAFGMDAAAITAAETAIASGGITSVVKDTQAGNAPAAITAAVDNVKAANPSYENPTIASTTTVGTASTSGASSAFSFGIMASIAAVFASLM